MFVDIFGSSTSDVTEACRRRDVVALTRSDQHFVAVIEDNEETILASSTSGVVPYFYAVAENNIFHGSNVIDVLRRAGLKRDYDTTALGDLITLGHLLDDATLHPQVRRVPPRSAVRFRHGVLTIETTPFDAAYPTERVAPKTLVERFRDVCGRLADGEEPVVSISGGLDSRAILAALLALGYRPRLLVTGFTDSSDVVVASELAAKAGGLPLERVELTADHYVAAAEDIVRASDGTKVTTHWHSYLYPRHANAGITNEPMFVGSNGEFARGYYETKLPAPAALDALSPLSLPAFWALKTKLVPRRGGATTFRPEEHDALAPGLAATLSRRGLAERVSRLCGACGWRFSSGLNRFYLDERVRHFIANGLRLYRETRPWRAPFLDPGWIAGARGLERGMRRGSAWHRFAIQRLAPALSEVPLDGDLSPHVPYDRYAAWLSDPRILDRLGDEAPKLEPLLSPATLRAIVEAHRADQSRTAAIAFLYTQLCWQHVLDAEGIA